MIAVYPKQEQLAALLASPESGPVVMLNLLRFNVFLSLRGWLDSVERFNAVLRAVAEREQLQIIDVSAALSGRAELFGLRRDHGPQRQLLQMSQLWLDERMLVSLDRGPASR